MEERICVEVRSVSTPKSQILATLLPGRTFGLLPTFCIQKTRHKVRLIVRCEV